PILKTKGNVRLSRHMKWHDPEKLTESIVCSLKEISDGYASYQVVQSIHVNEFPSKRDGYTYDEVGFLGIWKERGKGHQPDAVRYGGIFRRHNILERIRKENIQEVWLWGAPYFGWDEYAMKIPGDRIFYPTDNPWFYRPYDIPECGRTIWVMGWNYERG